MIEIMAKRETPGKGPFALDREAWLKFRENQGRQCVNILIIKTMHS